MIIENKTVFIAGTALGGIGEAIMKKLLAQSNNLLVTSLNMSESRFPRVKSLSADCTSEEGINRLKDWIKTEVGSIDILINAVGGSLSSTNPLEIDGTFFNRVLEVNLTSAYLLTKLASQLMPEGGAIVHIVSSSAFEPSLNKMPYGVAKAGLVYLIRTMAQVLAPKIRINGVSPTYVFTQRHKHEIEEKAEKTGLSINELSKQRVKKQLLDYPLMPEDLNEMIEFAAMSPLMTGKILDASLGRIF